MDTITFEDFIRLDIRAGTIIDAELVPKSKKLVKLQVSFGEEKRTILAGIASMVPHLLNSDVKSLIYRQVVAVLNLAPREMMGIQSHGMLLAGESSDGKICLVSSSGIVEGGKIG